MKNNNESHIDKLFTEIDKNREDISHTNALYLLNPNNEILLSSLTMQVRTYIISNLKSSKSNES